MALRVAHLLLRLLLGGVILYSAAAKVGQSSAQTIYGEWTGDSRVAHRAFVAAEALWGLWIISGRWPRTAGLASIALLTAFNVLLVRELDSESPRPCGCRGPLARMLSPDLARLELKRSLLVNAGLMLAAGGIALIPIALRARRCRSGISIPGVTGGLSASVVHRKPSTGGQAASGIPQSPPSEHRHGQETNRTT